MSKKKIFLSLFVLIIGLVFLARSVYAIEDDASKKLAKSILEENAYATILGSLLSIYILWKFIAILLWLNRNPLRIWGIGFTGPKFRAQAVYKDYLAIVSYLKKNKIRPSLFLFVDRFSIPIFLFNYYIVHYIFSLIRSRYQGFFVAILEWTYNNMLHSAIFIIVFCIGIPVLIPFIMSKMIFQYDLSLRQSIKKEMERK